MRLRHLVVACDKTEAARAAQAAALSIARRVQARISVVYVATGVLQHPVEVPPEAVAAVLDRDALAAEEFDKLCRWWQSGPDATESGTGADVQVSCMVGFGLPSVEITRYAEDNEADLIVMTRKRHSQLRRMLLGDTADSVVRRSPVPCLFVPPDGFDGAHVLVAADGTERGLAVVHAGVGFAQAIGGDLSFVTVERARQDEPPQLTEQLPGERSALLARGLEQILEHGVGGAVEPEASPTDRLAVRRGSAVPEILQEVADTAAGVLVVGYHRGGPPGPLESGSVARQLTHRAPCAVLTVPL